AACGEYDVHADQIDAGEAAMKAALAWSEPVNLGANVNGASFEQSPGLSSDGLTLYFTSDRAGGFGAIDIWVSQRDCRSCEFGPAVNLGPSINTRFVDGSPNFS